MQLPSGSHTLLLAVSRAAAGHAVASAQGGMWSTSPVATARQQQWGCCLVVHQRLLGCCSAPNVMRLRHRMLLAADQRQPGMLYVIKGTNSSFRMVCCRCGRCARGPLTSQMTIWWSLLVSTWLDGLPLASGPFQDTVVLATVSRGLCCGCWTSGCAISSSSTESADSNESAQPPQQQAQAAYISPGCQWQMLLQRPPPQHTAYLVSQHGGLVGKALRQITAKWLQAWSSSVWIAHRLASLCITHTS